MLHLKTVELSCLETKRSKRFLFLSLGNVYETGAPNENIVQTHLNIALLNYFRI